MSIGHLVDLVEPGNETVDAVPCWTVTGMVDGSSQCPLDGCPMPDARCHRNANATEMPLPLPGLGAPDTEGTEVGRGFSI